MPGKISKIIKGFSKANALVVGDIMLDTYIFGRVSRTSPEAPVPIINVEKTESRLGGAGNVAMNIMALGGKAAICAVLGNDEAGRKITGLLKKNGIQSGQLLAGSSRITTEKTRIFSRNQQMLRYDSETESDLSSADEGSLLKKIFQSINSGKFSVVVLQDYNKGVLTPNVIHATIDLCGKKKIPVVVDPKKRNFFEYKNVALFKPNLREVNDALGIETDKTQSKSLEQAAAVLHAKLNNRITLITLSEGGAFITDHQTSRLLPASIRQVADVSGAGDTVLSAVSLCVASGIDLETTGKLVNIAGGLACEQVGVAPISREQFFLEAEKAL